MTMDLLIDSDESNSPSSSLPPSSPLPSPPSSQTSLHSSPEPSPVQTPSPAQPSSSSSRSPSPRIKRRRERREQQNEVTVYGLRPRPRKSVSKRESSSSFTLKKDTSPSQLNPPPSLDIVDSQIPQAYRAGRLEKWQLDILQEAFNSGVWCPGDITVQVLTQSLKNRTEKQVRDWFSHRRRKLREAGMSDKKSGTEDVTNAVEALLLLRKGA